MDFKSNRIQLIARSLLLFATLVFTVSLFFTESFVVTKTIMILLTSIQAYYLFKYLDKSNKEIIEFLKSIRYDDFSHTYPERKTGALTDDLHQEFNEVIKKFREIRAEKEANYQYLKTIVQHVGIGIITFDKAGEVQIINTAARRLLEVKELKNVNQLKNNHEILLHTFRDLKTGGRSLIKWQKSGDEIQVAVYAIELSLRGREFKLVSLQNIQSELEEKEMEAWQNLIRVLTHEIMNSVTPISSLAAVVETELSQYINSGKDIRDIDNESMEDFHLALKTIHTRSDSLIRFVSDFRNMTRIRHPNLTEVKIKEILDHIYALIKHEINEKNIVFDIKITPENLSIILDREQIEQVLINLIKNAVEALSENEELGKALKKIKVKGYTTTEGAFLAVCDNGTGIDEEALKKIFIPFFTTKKNGSGIGLSLSKQIMRLHGGSITAKSTLDEGTEFLLKFPV